MKFSYYFFAITALFFLSGCGGKSFKKSPLDNYIVQFENEPRYSVILKDMDVEGNFFKTYLHKYKVIREKDSIPYSEESEWMEVNEDFFWLHENHLGMTVLEKNGEGKISKAASPPGYGYVGNSRYGEWRTHNGNTFWSFYGKYRFMTDMFGMLYRPVYQADYYTYRNQRYYGRSSYFGPTRSGKSYYGTNSTQTQKENPNFYERRAKKSSWSKSRSKNSSRSRGYGFGK